MKEAFNRAVSRPIGTAILVGVITGSIIKIIRIVKRL